MAVFLSVIRTKNYTLLRGLVSPADKTFVELSSVLKAHFEPKSLVIAERYRFSCRNQGPSESIADFIADLRKLAVHCEFDAYLNEALETGWFSGCVMRQLERSFYPRLTLRCTRPYALLRAWSLLVRGHVRYKIQLPRGRTARCCSRVRVDHQLARVNHAFVVAVVTKANPL